MAMAGRSFKVVAFGVVNINVSSNPVTSNYLLPSSIISCLIYI